MDAKLKATAIFLTFMLLVGVIYAVGIQTNPVTWRYAKDFSVYTDVGLTKLLPNGSPIDFGVVSAGSFANTTYVQNDGTTPITITATINKGSMPVGYDLTVAYPDDQIIDVGSSNRVVFTLTIPANLAWVPTGVSATYSV